MKKIVKSISFIICTLFLINIICGWGMSTTARSGKLGGEITFWMQKYGNDTKTQQAFLDKITKDFKNKTGVTVKYSLIDWGQALTKYTLASTGGEAPDVAETFFAYSFVKMGGGKYGPMAIDDVVKSMGGFSNYYDFAKPECYMNGHWYALPWRGDTRVAMYNVNDFKAAGIKEFPKTYDELIKVGQKLTKKDKNGNITRAGYLPFVNQARFDQTWLSVLAGFGGKLMNNDYSKFTFLNSPAAKESLQFMQDSVYKYNIIPKDCVNPTFNALDLYMAGKSSIVLGVPADAMTNIKNQAPQLVSVTKSVLMPSKSGTSDISSIAFAAPVCVFKTSKNKEAAKEFLKFFVSKDVQLQAMKACNLISTHKDVAGTPYFNSDPWFKTFTSQNAHSQPGDMPLPEWSQIDAFPQGPINTMCSKVMAGDDVLKAITECKDAIKKILPGSVN